MGVGALEKKGGKFDVNGLIKDYYVYAGENISAGSFVEFVNGIAEQTMETSVDTSLTADTSVYYVGKTAKAVALDDNRVFIAHSYGNQYHLYGVVCTIANATITMGADTAIIASEYNGEYIAKLILLDNNRVFIAHSYSSSSYLYGIVCTINGTTITHGTNTKIVSTNYASRYMAPVLLESGKIFIPYSYNTSYILGGIVVTVSGTAISKGTAVQLGHKCHSTSTALLKDGRVFVTYNYSQNDIESRLGAKICSIDGTTITKDVEQYICATEYTGLRVDVIALENGNVFVTHGYGTDYHLYGLVCNVSGNTITAGTDTQLSADKSASYAMSLLLLQNDNVFIAYRNADEVNLCAMVVNVSNFIVSKLSDVVLNDQSHTALGISSVMLNNGTIFVAHNVGNSYYYLYAQIFGITDNIPSNNVVIPTYERQVRNVTSSNANGIAKTSGVGGDDTAHNEAVQVYVPDFSWVKEYNLIANGDFSDGLDDWTTSHADISVEDGSLKCVYPSTSATGTSRFPIAVGSIIKTINSTKNKYYYRFDTKIDETTVGTLSVKIALQSAVDFDVAKDGNWHTLSGIQKLTTAVDRTMIFYLYNPSAGDICYLDNVVLYDLTEIFGAGNEPSQEWCDANL